MTFKLGWIRAKKLAELKGYSEDSIKKDKAEGKFIEGLHWKKDEKNRVWWDYEAIDTLISEGFIFNV